MCAAKADGTGHLNLDGTMVPTDRCQASGPNGADLWWSGKHKRKLMDALAPGSFLTLFTVTTDSNPEQMMQVVREHWERGITVQPRTKPEVETFFDGLVLEDPGITLVHRWRLDDRMTLGPRYGAVGRKE
jgi:hypothetical protein